MLLIYEAHLLHQDALNHLHILANYGWDSRALRSIVLVGLPELEGHLALRQNRSLQSRMHTRLHLGSAAVDDTADYLTYRTTHAGAEKGPFSVDAIAVLHEASGGRLRELDHIATNALKRAARRKVRLVDRSVINHVLDARNSRKRFDGHRSPGARPGGRWPSYLVMNITLCQRVPTRD